MYLSFPFLSILPQQTLCLSSLARPFFPSFLPSSFPSSFLSRDQGKEGATHEVHSKAWTVIEWRHFIWIFSLHTLASPSPFSLPPSTLTQQLILCYFLLARAKSGVVVFLKRSDLIFLSFLLSFLPSRNQLRESVGKCVKGCACTFRKQ